MCAQAVRFVHTLDEPVFLRLLQKSFDEFDECRISVAYASYHAFAELRKNISSFLRRNGSLKFLADVQRLFTDPDLIEELATEPGDCECKVYCGLQNPPAVPGRAFHPKLYLFRSGRRFRVIVGSANFTVGGLDKNIEAGAVVDADGRNPFITDALTFWQRTWQDEGAIYPTGPFLEKYRDASRRFGRGASQREQKFADEVGVIIAAEVARNRSERGVGVAYLLGLIAGGGWFSKADSNSFRIRFSSRERVHGDVRGLIAAPEITSYSIKQDDAISSDGRRICEYLNTFLHASKQGTATSGKSTAYSFSLDVCLDSTSITARQVKEFVASGEINRKRFYPDHVPGVAGKGVGSDVTLAFLKGYFDTRGRLSVADRIPDNRLRIAMSVSPRADRFGRELLALLKKQFRIAPERCNYLEGPGRQRETMIRIDADAVPGALFTSAWQSILHQEFSDFNKTHFAQ